MWLFPMLAVGIVLMTGGAPNAKVIVVKSDLTLKGNIPPNTRLVIQADHVTIDGGGATLVGPGVSGQPKTFTDVAITANGCSHVTLRNIKAKGWQTGLNASGGQGWLIENCDFSDNYTDPEFGWGNGDRVGGMILTGISRSIIRKNVANRVWNGLDLENCDDNQVTANDLSHCSNVCLKMLTACRNTISDNNLSYGLRIKPGETHARDSTSVLIESGSNHNRFFRNDASHGGDGIFIRVLNNHVSTGNLFVENDVSYANNNGFEAWSPGNTYLRNRANHCSYGFWLGASDQTTLIGNEAAYNGLPDGKHNAPELDFAHGGIVFVNGPSTHSLVSGNYCHHNGGGGIVFRGDRRTKGGAWKAQHWVLQNNRLENNRWGIVGMYADQIHIANNSEKDNAEPDKFVDVQNLTQKDDPSVTQAPHAALAGPTKALVGQVVTFDASGSSDPAGRPLAFGWMPSGETAEGSLFRRIATEAGIYQGTFVKPGFYRVGMTVSNGVLADLAYRDVIVVAPVEEEIGTEGGAEKWGFAIAEDPKGEAKLLFMDDTESVLGRTSLRFSPRPYPGAAVTALYPRTKDAKWNLSAKKTLSFWIKLENPNPTGFQNQGPEIHLIGAGGEYLYTPVGDKNFLRDPGYSEGRWMWVRLEISLAGGGDWKREAKGTVTLNSIQQIGFTFDSYEYAPFTVWLDGIAFE